jgi:hypothetical protein
MLFEGGERFPDSRSEFTGNLSEGIQDVFFSYRLRLLLIENFAAFASKLVASIPMVLPLSVGQQGVTPALVCTGA